MGYVYISYANKDSDFVNRLLQALKQAGIQLATNSGSIAGGHEFASEIMLAGADSAIVVISPASVESQRVRDEVSLALDLELRNRDFKLVPIQKEGVEKAELDQLSPLLTLRVIIDFSDIKQFESSVHIIVGTLPDPAKQDRLLAIAAPQSNRYVSYICHVGCSG